MSGWAVPSLQETAPAPAAPTPVRRYRCRLDTVGHVSAELAKVYREARSGLLPVDHASKLSHVLTCIARIIADGQLEARVEALEAQRRSA